MKHTCKQAIITAILLLLLTSCCKNEEIVFPPEYNKMDWWDDAKFGMFIHFGVYSVPAGRFAGTDLNGITYPAGAPKLSAGVGAEWIMYTAEIPRETYKLYANDFTANRFDANQIADMAKSAGMKYVVITLKHHDGFVMYPTQLTDWNISNSAAKGKDVIAEMQEACVSRGLRFGVYFSQNIDWMTDGSYGYIPEIKKKEEDHGDYNTYTEKLIKEFVARYPHIDLIWWDGYNENGDHNAASRFVEAAQSIRPGIIFNDRLDTRHEGDYITPEMHLNLPVQQFKRFELCTSINKKSWGYSESDYQTQYMTKDEMIVNLLRCIQYGGNMLLNIGPAPDGSISPLQSQPLREAGEIISKMGGIRNAKSLKQVYGQHNCLCRYVSEGGNSLLYVTRMPDTGSGEIRVTGIRNNLLSAKTAHTVTKEGNTLIISGFNGEFDTACILLAGKMDSYDAGIDLPCQGIISPLSAYPAGEFGISTGDNNRFMLTNWKGGSGSIEYMVHVTEDRAYNISVYTAEMDNLEITLNADNQQYNSPIQTGYQRHKSTLANACYLSKGNHVITLTITSPKETWANFYGIEFE